MTDKREQRRQTRALENIAKSTRQAPQRSEVMGSIAVPMITEQFQAIQQEMSSLRDAIGVMTASFEELKQAMMRDPESFQDPGKWHSSDLSGGAGDSEVPTGPRSDVGGDT